jgi:uncharacterized membrane protein (DUF485 family)
MSIIEEIVKQHVIKDPPSKAFLMLLGMVNTYPKNAKFATQNPDEYVVMIVRKHVFRNASWLINAFLAFIMPLLLIAVIGYWDVNFNESLFSTSELVMGANTQILFALLLFYFGFVATYVYFSFIHWFYDVFIITNERYISIDFDILHGRTIVDIPLSDIIDVSEKVLGFLPTLIGYGNIEFKTTSEKFIILDNIPNPTWFRDSFVDLIHFIRGRKAPKAKPEVKNPQEKLENIISEKLEEAVAELKDETPAVVADSSPPVTNSSKYLEP